MNCLEVVFVENLRKGPKCLSVCSQPIGRPVLQYDLRCADSALFEFNPSFGKVFVSDFFPHPIRRTACSFVYEIILGTETLCIVPPCAL